MITISDNNAGDVEQSLKEELNSESGKTKPDEKNDDAQSSSTTPAVTEEKKFSLPGHKDADGKDILYTADQVVEEYKKFQTDYTRKIEEINKPQETVKEDKEQTKVDNGVITDPKDAAVLAELKNKFKVVTVDDLTKLFADREQAIVTKAVDTSSAKSQLEEALGELETSFDGGKEMIGETEVAKPKVERKAILDYIIANPAIKMSPLEIARHLYFDDFVKYQNAKTLAGGTSGLPKTEGQGSESGSTPPKYTKRYDFGDGSTEKAVRDIIEGVK